MTGHSSTSTAAAWRPTAMDVVLGVVVVAVGAQILSAAGGGEGFRSADPVAHALTAVGCATTAWARCQPLAALLVAGAAATILVTLDHHVDVLPFVVAWLLFMTASYASRRDAALGLTAAAIFLALSAATRPADLGAGALAQSSIVFVATWSLGKLVGGRRTALLALVTAAEQRAVVERELAAAELDRGRLALVDERLAIARDVHDVLAHSMGVISVQATVGAHLSVEDPAAARQALVTISEVTRSSMEDLRQMLTLLRNDSTVARADCVTYEPAPGLTALEPLIETYRAAGLSVQTNSSGVPRALTASADLSAYRVVQEALTNTLKHSGARHATVGLHYSESAVRVVVSDDGGPSEPTHGGHGLVGMRERIALLGGQLQAGPAAGGFTVAATIPYREGDNEVTS